MSRHPLQPTVACLAFVLGAPAGVLAGSPWAPTAAGILRSAGVETGLCVHLGCADGRLTAELARGRNLLVHGLAADRKAVHAARRHIDDEGLYGQASVDSADLSRLPYADNLVNLIVVDDLPRLAKAGLSLREVMRVLCPSGVACLGQAAEAPRRLTEPELRRLLAAAGIETFQLARENGLWAVVRKPRPPAMDDWTHRTYDASGNCVSRDTAIGPLHGLRWIAGPAWPLGTYYQVSNGGTVAAGGRVFSVTLNVVWNVPKTPQDRNHSWFLTARDAHNGLLLWSRPIGRRMARDGQEFGNYLVATPERVFALLGQDLVALDPATGATQRVLVRNVPTGGRLVHHGGLLVVTGGKAVQAIDPATGRPRWTRPGAAQGLVADEGRVLITAGGQKELVCIDLASGRQQWRADISAFKGKKKQLLFAKAGIAVVVWERNWQKGHNGIAAFSARDGKLLWGLEYESSRATWCNAVWLVDRLVWHRQGKAGLAGRGPLSGETKRQIQLKGGYCGGCVRDIATARYLVSTRPPNFFEWTDGTVHGFRAGRHGCRAGVIVANGLLYSQPHGCKCVREALRGFVAFAPAAGAPRPASARLGRGPAAGVEPPETPAPAGQEWPTFRHDARRTGGTDMKVPANLTLAWTAKLDDQERPPQPLADEWLAHPLGGDRLTAPSAADGKVFVALTDAHRLVALDGRSGREVWSYTAGGRLDTPPTIHRGLCLLGCYDGWVYALRASDGTLAWRLRAAPRERRIVAFGQVESAWPVVGGVVVVDEGVACVVAGRSSAADGGVWGTGFDPRSGKVLWRRPLRAACADLLVSGAAGLRMAGGGSAGFRFDARTGAPLRGGVSPGFRWQYSGKIKTLWGGPNPVLDRTWRVLGAGDRASHWMRIKQGYGPHEGKLLVASHDLARVYGFGFKYVHWSKEKDPATELGGLLVAWEGGKKTWEVAVPKTFQIEAMILAGNVLFAAGPTDRFRRTPGGKLWAVSASDGKVLLDHPLTVAPAADGLAAAYGRLFLSTADGRLLSFATQR